MKCGKCGAMIKDDEGYAEDIGDMGEMGEGEMGVKDSVLAELIETMQGSVGEGLKKKPAIMAIEIKKKG